VYYGTIEVMEIECVLQKLKQAVAKTERITTKKASLSVLECLLLEAEDGQLTIQATNLDIGIKINVPVKVETPGKIAVPADVFSRYLSHLPEQGAVTLSTEDSTLQVSSNTTETEIKIQPTDEFPSIPDVEDGDEVTIPADKLISGFDSVWYAASPSSMKPELSSVSVYTKDDSLYFVATDSFRLAEKKIADVSIADLSILVPHQNVSEIIRIFRDIDDDLTLLVGENQLIIKNESIYVSSRLIDGSFPDYTKIIPNSSSVTATVSKQELSDTLRLSDIFSDKFNQLTISANPNKNQLTFTTSNADIGENTTNINSEIEGDELTSQFNHSYITDAFQSLSGESVNLSLSADAPMVIKAEDDDSFLYLVMPMSN
jgi:DNA polymerase-3 subunit beta